MCITGEYYHTYKSCNSSIPICLLKPICNTRRYTKFYGTNGDAAAKIARDAILGNGFTGPVVSTINDCHATSKCSLYPTFSATVW